MVYWIVGQGVRIASVDEGFNFEHINLKRDNFVNLTPSIGKDEHSTAVAGVMYAKDMGLGVKGMVHGADIFYSTSELENDALTKVLLYLRTGDVINRYLGDGGSVPMDHLLGIWDITVEALRASIVLCFSAYSQRCFVLKARKKALEADVVVVNHHLFMADKVVKDTGFSE